MFLPDQRIHHARQVVDLLEAVDAVIDIRAKPVDKSLVGEGQLHAGRRQSDDLIRTDGRFLTESLKLSKRLQ